VRHQWCVSLQSLADERVRERERERESVRDERGAHSYNSCTCSKKAGSSSSSRSSRHGSLLNGVCWALRHSELVGLHYVTVILFRSKTGSSEKVQRGYISLSP
jgi:hypothetical protein